MNELLRYKAGREVNDKRMTEDVVALTTAVMSLQLTIERSKGAIWVIGSLSAGAGAIAAAIAAALIHSK